MREGRKLVWAFSCLLSVNNCFDRSKFLESTNASVLSWVFSLVILLISGYQKIHSKLEANLYCCSQSFGLTWV